MPISLTLQEASALLVKQRQLRAELDRAIQEARTARAELDRAARLQLDLEDAQVGFCLFKVFSPEPLGNCEGVSDVSSWLRPCILVLSSFH